MGVNYQEYCNANFGPEDIDCYDDCWNCGGEGYVYNCQDEIACVDPESGCDLCMSRCRECNKTQSSPQVNEQ